MLKKYISLLMVLSMTFAFSGCAPEYPEIDVPEVTEPLENAEIKARAFFSEVFGEYL